MEDCIRTPLTNTYLDTETTLLFRTNSKNSPIIVVEARTNAGEMVISVLSPEKKVLLHPTQIADGSAFEFVRNPFLYFSRWVYTADLNADGKPDFYTSISKGGCGSAAAFEDAIILLSHGDRYEIKIIPTMCTGPEDFVDGDGDGIASFVQTTGDWNEEEMVLMRCFSLVRMDTSKSDDTKSGGI